MNLTILNDNDVTPAEMQTFTYDPVGRLASASSTAYGSRAYTYDKVGNRLSEVRTLPATAAVTQSYTYPTTSNRLTNIKQGTTTLRAFTYDAAGNVIQDSRSGTAWNYTINKAGRLNIVKQGTTTKGTYLYDGRQRLASRVVANTTGYNGTAHILHGYVGCSEPMNENALLGGTPCDRVLAETDGTGPTGTKHEYIWLGDMPVAVIDKSVTPNKTYMVHADHLNRPQFMTDSTRAQVWKAIYEPFGTVYSTTGTAAQTLRFPGQWFQIEAGLAYNWHRHYDAALGRYVSADPLGLYDGASVFGYVGQAPLEGVDETGLWWWLARPIIGGIVGTALDAGYQYYRYGWGCVDFTKAFLRGGLIAAGIGYKPGTQFRFTIKDKHPHNFRSGNRDHAQLDTWVKGLRNSHSTIRIPYGPSRSWHNK